MHYIDIIILIFIFSGIYYGYENGFVKTMVNFINIYLSMILAALLNKPLYNLIYDILPFYNFKDASSLNIILHRILIYIFLMIFISLMIEFFLKKRNIDKYLLETSVEASKTSKLLGSIVGIFLMFIFTYNILYFFLFPSVNITKNEKSTLGKIVLKNTLVVSSINKSVYKSLIYSNNEINNIKNKKNTNYKIVKNMVVNNVIDIKKIYNLNGNLDIRIDVLIKEVNNEK